MYELYFSFVHMLVCKFGCRHPCSWGVS